MLAQQACASCRKQKRKCDKQLPSCGLCLRIKRNCDYNLEPPATSGAPSSEEFDELRRQVEELQAVLAVSGNGTAAAPDMTTPNSNSFGTTSPGNGTRESRPMATMQSLPGPTRGFPSLFFLDGEMFEYLRNTVQAPYVQVPPGALQLLGSSAELMQMTEHYFNTVHVFFNVISKIRLFQHLTNPGYRLGADMALLFLSMKMAMAEPSGENVSGLPQIYQDVKSLYTYVESQNGFSIRLIQAGLLISLYEIGHAIYPAAYLTVGNCARLGHATGLHDRGMAQMLPRPTTWTEQEERRRVWWGPYTWGDPTRMICAN
jgi:hypothetical protein